LLKRYLFVYLLATLSDWLQGPYVYALYMEYGFKQHEIAQLFVAGFASSMIFGSFVGSMADWGGRKSFVIIYAVVYAASCLTKREYRNLDASTF
jgi:MFS family permease